MPQCFALCGQKDGRDRMQLNAMTAIAKALDLAAAMLAIKTAALILEAYMLLSLLPQQHCAIDEFVRLSHQTHRNGENFVNTSFGFACFVYSM